MNPIIDVENSPSMRELISEFYRLSEVQGFALGVHSNYVSKFRNQFGKDFSIDDIIKDNRIPQDWVKICEEAKYDGTLSPIYIIIYINGDEKHFCSQYKVPRTISPNHAVFIESIAPVFGLHDRVRHRPILGGISISSTGSRAMKNSAGTLGGFLKEKYSGDIYIISCNHVLLDVGDDVIQNALSDGGSSSSDMVAKTTYSTPLSPSKSFSFSDPYYKADASLAKIDSNIQFQLQIRSIAKISSAPALKQDLSLGDDVVFVGKESDIQDAEIFRHIARLKVDLFDDGDLYNFGDVFEIRSRSHLYVGTLSKPGDSGSLILIDSDDKNKEKQVYGLLFAGSTDGKLAFCCFIDEVLDELEYQAKNANPYQSFQLEIA